MIRKLRNKDRMSGFTLAELLVVVAIIAVLVAIAIPIFKSQLDKAKDASTVANVRSAYAEASTAVLDGQVGTVGNITVSAAGPNTLAKVTEVYLNVATSDLSGQGDDLPLDSDSITFLGTKKGSPGTYSLVFEFYEDGTVSIIGIGTS